MAQEWRLDITTDPSSQTRALSRTGSRRCRAHGCIGRATWGGGGLMDDCITSGACDHQVKVRGFRIELGEIESVLCQHALVREAVVALAASGDTDEKRLVAYVVPGGLVPVVSDLREHLRQTLPDYMVPTAFVFIDKLPLTNNGKVDRNALPKAASVDTISTEGYLSALHGDREGRDADFCGSARHQRRRCEPEFLRAWWSFPFSDARVGPVASAFKH